MKFKLQKVLEVRKIIEKEREKDLSLSLQKLVLAEKELDRLYLKRSSFTDSMKFGIGTIVRSISEHHDYLASLTKTINDQNNTIDEIKKEVEKKQQILMSAVQDRKVIEKLKEKAQLEFEKEMAVKEQGFLDEIAMRKYGIE